MSKSKTIFITGANRGIGLNLVKLMNERFQPEFLIATFRSKDQAKELHEYAASNKNVHLIQMEVTDETKYADVVAQVDKLNGGAGVNLLINNAGILTSKDSSIADINKETLRQHLDVNTISPILITQAFIPLLEKASNAAKASPIGIGRAAVVNISTFLASIQFDTGAYLAYRVSKTALNMATHSIGTDLIKKGILSIPIHPGWVQTDMGGAEAPLTVEQSVVGIVNTLEGLNENSNGQFYSFDGTKLPW